MSAFNKINEAALKARVLNLAICGLGTSNGERSPAHNDLLGMQEMAGDIFNMLEDAMSAIDIEWDCVRKKSELKQAA